MSPGRAARVGPTLAVFGCVVVMNAIAMPLLFSRGFAFMVSAPGVALGLALTLALAAACGAVLGRVKGLDRAAAGLVIDARAARECAAATGIAMISVVALLAALAATGQGSLQGWRPIAPTLIAATLASSLVNAAFQQLGLQSLGLAARGASNAALGPSALTLALFVATHAPISTAPIYLLNVALFGALTIALFLGRERRSYGSPVGLHGGWNAALLLLGALQGEDSLAVVSWRGSASVWSGGVQGPESGLGYTVALVVMGGVLVALRRRARGVAQRESGRDGS